MSWFQRLKDGLKKTKEQLVGRLAQVLQPGRSLDDALLAELEEILITADVGVAATTEIVRELKRRAVARGVQDSSEVTGLLKEILKERLRPAEGTLQLRADGQPTIFLILGVNGSGKTTTIAKLAQHLKDDFGKRKIIFAAGDTFRAAAVEQLSIWAERTGAGLVQQKAGSDPSAVAFDAVERALREAADVVLIDTAGRLQTKQPLMEELRKINRVVEKRLGRALDERLLVLDGTTGQNAISQARLFHESVSVTGLVVTKLDGTAKGGALVQIAGELNLPIKLIGVGERADDLREFKADEFVEALL
ncbi:signal recognition particle-docking protein FtsY [Candidatus Acetothermia bacterium]|jgi:fused signal recognition particle receptor|nr:signal recognition particle-docking protein FtsY [Candidatus Acetothermia bacterium]MCI2432192.1 signal recognition particle-docking protein FtsY [Candidatus Acetothermia bacterium]MCI2436095.1 signal recognition particle-docking protein FtsY [Candidatus Acetothermia bacterium]